MVKPKRTRPAPPAPAVFRTKQEVVFAALRQRIMDGALAPGSRLVIDDIATEHGVSPIPVREALHRLQAERLVELRPHLGAVVAPLSREAIRETFTLMEALELAAFRLAVERAGPADLANLRELTAAMSGRSLPAGRWAAANQAFHAAICAIAGTPRIAEMTAQVFADWERLRRCFFKELAPPDLARAHREHLAMIEALARRDLAKLEKLAQVHNRSALACLLRGFAPTA